MKTINVTQGSADWLALRAKHHTASEAPTMMSASRYQTRDQLLHQKHTGITQEVDGHTQALFDRGHATEALARVLLEEELGEDLYPITGISGDGSLLASFDGITMDGSTGFEHKLWGERLAGQVRAGDLEPHYFWQLEQQCLVAGLEKVIFVTSDGTRENWAQMTYHPVPGRAEQLIAGWAQFAADLACYEPPASKPSPVVGRAPDSLPALRIEISGAVTASNLAEFKATALAAIQGVKQTLTTDADFADADASVKWCADIESRVAAAKQHAMSQTADIDALFRTMDDISAEARHVRLVLEKSIKAEKEHRRGEIVAGGVAALRSYVENLNMALGRHYVPMVPADFGGAVKGKRSLDSIQSAVNDELARAKIAASEVATRIQTNLKTLHDTPGVVLTLFPDIATLVLKQPDDFAMVVSSRMAQHHAAEQARMDAQRERIRIEEQAAAQKAAQEQMARERAAAAQQELARALAAQQVDADVAEEQASAKAAEAISRAAVAPPAQQQQPDDGERINLSAINEQLYPIKLDAAGLAYLGFEPVATVKASKLYRASDLTTIRARLIEQLTHPAEMEAST